MLRRAHGFGGVEVYLLGGMHVEVAEGEETVAYDDLDGLFTALGRAIALRDNDMTGAEARYLRKRLGMSQAELGMLGGKSEQVAAKWEKARLPMPKAEANLLRLRWLQRYLPDEVSGAVERLTGPHACKQQRSYLLGFHSGQWSELPDAVVATEAHHTGEVFNSPLRVSRANQDSAGYAKPEVHLFSIRGALATFAGLTLGENKRAFA